MKVNKKKSEKTINIFYLSLYNVQFNQNYILCVSLCVQLKLHIIYFKFVYTFVYLM